MPLSIDELRCLVEHRMANAKRHLDCRQLHLMVPELERCLLLIEHWKRAPDEAELDLISRPVRD